MNLSQKDKINYMSSHCEPEKLYTVIRFILSRRLRVKGVFLLIVGITQLGA